MLHLMLPEQFPPRTARLAAAQRRLMVAVLQTALDDCQGTATARAIGSPVPRDRKETREAIAFVRSPDRSWPYSFLNICDAIGLDAESVRRTICRCIAIDA
jgi:hypothetical protein